MCRTCGCHSTASSEKPHTGKSISVQESLLSENDRQAAHNREHLNQNGVLAINVMSSPGAGKTSLLEETVELLQGELNTAVIVGDLETERDAQRLRSQGIEAIQITTGSACHLNAAMVHDALHQLDLTKLDLVFIENVGNLVCPASFTLGEHRNITLLAVTEGYDKPAKYPVMFRLADLVLLTKCDLLSAIDDFDVAEATRCLRHLANECPILECSAKQGQGMEAWLDWLRRERRAHFSRKSPDRQGHYTSQSSVGFPFN